ncbi:MAG: type IX secretion system membrane protein PorP/SprF [Bacteroidetes bacterium]|nr:type IX secretion system membrane protein PorP/SprF [Bacteroidota bacterium]
MKATSFVATFVLFFLFSVEGFAQQLPEHSQYMYDPFIVNPAVAGSKSYFPLLASYRNQWTGFADNPKTMLLSMHGELKKNISVGGIIFSDKTGPTSRTGLVAAYSYHLPVGKNTLAFGLSMMGFRYSLDKSKLTTDLPDPAIQGEVVQKIVPEATFGMFYWGKNYYAGFAAPQLIQMRVDIGGSEVLNRMVRHYFLTGGYKFAFSDYAVEPSFLVKATAAAPVQFDINSRFYYKEIAWLGLSYRNQESVVLMFGGKKDIYALGYSYDITLSDIKNYSTGSHEIFLSVDLFKKKQKASFE